MMMPIMMTTPEPDARASRQSGADAGSRKAAGSAFEGAIRAANGQGGDKRPRADRADGTEPATPKGAEAAEADSIEAAIEDGVRADETDGEAVPGRAADMPSEGAPRLGDVLALLTLANRTGEARTTGGEATPKTATDGAPATDTALEGTDPLGEKSRMRLAVLRMETHFEPTVQTPVLVEAQAEATSKAVAAAAEGLAEVLVGLKRALDERGVRDDRQTAATSAKSGALSLETDQKRGVKAEAIAADGEAQHDDRKAAIADASGLVEDVATAARLLARREGAASRGVFLAARDVDRSAMPTPATAPATLNASMSTQVAATVIDALPVPDAPAAPNTPRAPAEAELRMRAGGAALKTLTIQLQPEHLGVLDISMRLVDGQLSLELSADKADTARLLIEDRAGLKALLEQAGFSLDDASISVVARESAPQAGGRGGDTGSGERAANDSRREDTNGQGQGRSFGEPNGEQPSRRQQTAAPAGREGRAGSVFL